MPTLYAPQLVETETPWLEIWDRMYQGLLPHARRILVILGYYTERDLQVPSAESPLTEEEVSELAPIASGLTIAAVETNRMRDGIFVATLKEVAKVATFSSEELPAAVQWELAHDYQRREETPGSFAMDIWGTEQTRTPYIRGEPTPENVARAAERAATRIQKARSPGRPPHPAHPILVERLGRIFRGSGQSIVRHRIKTGELRENIGKQIVVYEETGPFHEFLELVLPPLRDHLREHRLAPVTTDSIVRLALDNR